MNTQTLKRLAGVLVALVAIWLVLGLTRRVHRDTERRLSLVRFDPKSVDNVEITRGADSVRFIRQGDAWRVNGHPADAALVGELLYALTNSSAQSELIAENASSHTQLGLDTSNARRVSVRHGGITLSELLVGHSGSSGSAYVRKPGDNASYQLKGELAAMANRQPDDWRDRVIARVVPESVAVVDVQRGKKAYSLTRGDKGWSIGNVAADSAAVAGLLNQLQNLDAAGFATAAQADSASFTPADRTLRVAAKGGRALVALSMDSTANGFWVRRDGDSTTYRLDSWVANQLTPVDSTLRKK